MKTGLIGHNKITLGDKHGFIFYHPFENAGWSVSIVCPESDIFSSYYSLQRLTLVISLIGLLLLALFCLFISHYQLRPLQHLVDAAQRGGRCPTYGEWPDGRAGEGEPPSRRGGVCAE